MDLYRAVPVSLGKGEDRERLGRQGRGREGDGVGQDRGPPSGGTGGAVLPLLPPQSRSDSSLQCEPLILPSQVTAPPPFAHLALVAGLWGSEQLPLARRGDTPLCHLSPHPAL